MVRAQVLVLAAATGCLATTSASAAPDPRITGKSPPPGRHPIGPVADLPFGDDFDSYQDGQKLSTCGTWKKWAQNSVDATVTSSNSNSKPNSVKLEAQSDNIQSGQIASGRVTLSAMTYFPAGSLNQGGGWVIGLNTFGAANNWSMQVAWDNTLFSPPFPGQMGNYDGIAQGDEAPTDILFDQWVEFRVDIDLDNDSWDAFYGGVQIVHTRSWSDGASGGGLKEFQCLDFYSSGNSALLFDDIRVTTGACEADCDRSGELDIDDFICFQTLFALGDRAADCDHNGTLDFDDFVCFQAAFVAGCP